MHTYYSYIFFTLYFLFSIIGIYVYLHFNSFFSHKDKELKNNVKNVLLITDKILLSMSKNDNNEIVDLKEFPKELYKYIRKPTPLFLSESILYISTSEETESNLDINRCISISSLLFKKEIPLIFVKLDKRTRLLYNILVEELSLRHVLVMRFYIDKIESIIKDNHEECLENVRKYFPILKIVGEEILNLNDEHSFSSLEYFTENINIKHKKKYSENEIKSLCTAFSAITNIKIPKIYISVDIIALSLIYYFKIRKNNYVL